MAPRNSFSFGSGVGKHSIIQEVPKLNIEYVDTTTLGARDAWSNAPQLRDCNYFVCR